MPTDVLLPQWGMNMQEGTLIRWLKKEGDAVQQGEPLVEVETAKINSELEAPTSGVVARILVSEGDTVSVGTALAVIAAPGEEVASIPDQADTEGEKLGAAQEVERQESASAASSPSVQIVPAARLLARQHEVSLAEVRGSGPSGRILVEDVEQAIEARLQTASKEVPLSGPRKTIAERMLHSAQSTAPVTLVAEVDMTNAETLRRALVAEWREHRVRPMAQDLIVMAVSRALRKHPTLNASIDDNVLRLHEAINVGVAMALKDGLTVGVTRNTDTKSLIAIAQSIRELAFKAKDERLAPDDVTGGTFTVTSLANVEIDLFSPLINPPEVAILGIGRIAERPVAYEGSIAIRSMMYLSLTFDHRALDGVPAGQFVQEVKHLLESPHWMTA